MKSLKDKRVGGDRIVYVDIDKTLVYWNNPPHSSFNNSFQINGIYFYYNIEVVEQIKQHTYRGHSVVIWSKAGMFWIEQVVKALELDPYIDAYMSKPSWIIDDLPSEDWMPKSNYFGDRELE